MKILILENTDKTKFKTPSFSKEEVLLHNSSKCASLKFMRRMSYLHAEIYLQINMLK